MPPKAAALPKDVFFERCVSTIISARDIRALTKDESFSLITTRNEQLIFFMQFLRDVCFISPSAKLLSIMFNISESQVRKIICKSKKDPKQVGRPFIFNEETENLIVAEIRSKRNTHDFMTLSQILKYVEKNFNKSLTYGWLNTFISRHQNSIKKTVVSAQEDLRLTVPRIYLKEYLDLVEVLIKITLAELIYNIDESGLSDWEERKPKTVLVPTEIDTGDLHYPVNRGIRHVTLVATVSGGGDAFFPLIVTSDPELERIFDLGVRRDIDLSIHVGNSNYISKEVFNDHIINKFIPQVMNDRKFCGNNNLPAILFLDNCSSHLDDMLLKILADNLILVISYPSHTSHIFQVLDLLLFGVLKVHKKSIQKNDEISPKIDHLYRIFHAYELSTCSTTIRSSFSRAGFEYYQKNGKNYLRLNRQKIENSKNFKEVWDINYPEEKLSARRRNSKRGWINQQYFPKKFQRKVLNK